MLRSTQGFPKQQRADGRVHNTKSKVHMKNGEDDMFVTCKLNDQKPMRKNLFIDSKHISDKIIGWTDKKECFILITSLLIFSHQQGQNKLSKQFMY